MADYYSSKLNKCSVDLQNKFLKNFDASKILKSIFAEYNYKDIIQEVKLESTLKDKTYLRFIIDPCTNVGISITSDLKFIYKMKNNHLINDKIKIEDLDSTAVYYYRRYLFVLNTKNFYTIHFDRNDESHQICNEEIVRAQMFNQNNLMFILYQKINELFDFYLSIMDTDTNIIIETLKFKNEVDFEFKSFLHNEFIYFINTNSSKIEKFYDRFTKKFYDVEIPLGVTVFSVSCYDDILYVVDKSFQLNKLKLTTKD